MVYFRQGILTKLLLADVVLRAALPAPDHRVQPELLHDARPLLRLLRPGRVQGEREGRPARGRGLSSLLLQIPISLCLRFGLDRDARVVNMHFTAVIVILDRIRTAEKSVSLEN